MERNKLKIKYTALIYLLFAVFWFWLAAQIPYTHDDWDWGLDIGLQQLLTASVNSRYVGNFFVVIMTRSELLKTLIMGSVSFLLPLMMVEIIHCSGHVCTGGGRIALFVFANFLLLTVDRNIWRQTYGWVSGYANYVISAPLMLLCLCVCFQTFDSSLPQTRKTTPVCYAGIFLLGVAVQLFLENLAIYTVLLCLTFCAIGYIRDKKLSPRLLCLLAGAVIGLVIMFSSSIYSTLWTEGKAVGGYRKFNFQSNVKETVFNWAYRAAIVIIKVFEYNLSSSIAILILMSALLIRRRSRLNTAAAIFNGALCLYFLYNWIRGATPNIWFEALVNGLFFLLIAGEVFLLFSTDRSHLNKLLALWVSAPTVIVPLIITTELGDRLFLTSNIFLIVFALMLLDVLLCGMGKKSCRTLALCGIASVFAVLLFYVGIYSQIGACKVQRESSVSKAIETNAESVTLPKFPHSEYLWCADPGDDGRKVFFREFYGLAPDTEIVFEE